MERLSTAIVAIASGSAALTVSVAVSAVVEHPGSARAPARISAGAVMKAGFVAK